MKPAALLPILASLPVTVFAQNVTAIPSVPGPYAVSVREFQLNTSRDDFEAPTPRQRSLMLSIFQPTYRVSECPRNVTIPYIKSPVDRILLDAVSAQTGLQIPNTTFEALSLQTCPQSASEPCNPPSLDDEAPLLLFSPGSALSRLIYGAICQAVASSGYTVISIDHTWEAVAVQFADGSIAYDQLTGPQFSTNRTVIDAYSQQQTDVRVFDSLSVLNAVERNQIPWLQHRRGSRLRAGMFGHSMGGSTATAVAQNTSMVVAAANFDGTFLSYVPDKKLNKPLLAVSNQTGGDASWDQMYRNSKAWTAYWRVNGSEHGSFTDYPIDLATLGLQQALGSQLNPLVGSIQGIRMLEIVRSYTVAFFDFALKGQKPEDFLIKETKEFPELTKVR